MTAIEFNYQLTRLSENLERFALSLTSNREDAKDLLQENLCQGYFVPRQIC
jgi:DNA-directed RNA polymerase specialized sigma24 family protein